MTIDGHKRSWRVKYTRHDPQLRAEAVGVRYLTAETEKEARQSVIADFRKIYGEAPVILEVIEDTFRPKRHN